ncbi:MAG: N-acetylglucosamine-6-phosphate deacetylase [Lachnospiraceae bacterium]|nr:N-acetylglucosamine-6-phosphate deacetylase [Lachnospiraceae bacterium]
MKIKNAKIYTEDKTFEEGEILIKDGVFAEKASEDEVVDADGCYAIPGLIDLHFHGCVGYDICDGTPEALAKIAAYEASIGVTGIAPATMTLPVEELEQILSVAAAYRRETEGRVLGADLIGINMEGPFISKSKKGAQDARNIIPYRAEVCRRFLAASEGLVKFIGIAPEDNPEFVRLIEEMKDSVNISLAHTNADYDTAMAAFAAGANHAVHLYNAMPPFTHRAPGVVGAVADSPHVYAELICDGIHIHPSVVRATFRMLGEDRIVLISDSMRATGMPDGEYTLGGLEVTVKGRRATLVSDGALAGSATNLMDCMRTVVKEMQIPLETAVACATMNPAKSLGVFDTRGSIRVGKKADVVLLDEELNLRAVIKDGKRIR